MQTRDKNGKWMEYPTILCVASRWGEKYFQFWENAICESYLGLYFSERDIFEKFQLWAKSSFAIGLFERRLSFLKIRSSTPHRSLCWKTQTFYYMHIAQWGIELHKDLKIAEIDNITNLKLEFLTLMKMEFCNQYFWHPTDFWNIHTIQFQNISCWWILQNSEQGYFSRL